jgi:hypothetical protein
MGMSFQGPPQPPPAFWREPAFWTTTVGVGAAAGAFHVGDGALQVAALFAGAVMVAAFSHYRMAARHQAEEQKAALWGKRSK